MSMPGFIIELPVQEPRWARHYRQVLHINNVGGAIRPQQETCESHWCPDGRPMVGEFPQCYCEEPPPPPRCDLEVTCPPGLVAYGDWPDCGCKRPDNPEPPPGGGGGGGGGGENPGSGLGGLATCHQFYTCPPHMLMAEGDNGECVCK
jgi:hypothetical protein